MRIKNNFKFNFIFGLVFLITACGGSGSNSNDIQYESGVIFGNIQGLVYKNNSLLAGNVAPQTLDQSNILTLIKGQNGILYAGTNSSAGGHVFTYNLESQLWMMLPNNLNTYFALDYNGSVNALALDHTGKLYGATSSGKVLFYANNAWLGVSNSILDGSSVNALAVDSNNNLYAGTSNGNVFKYTNFSWQQLNGINYGSITALATDINNNLYASSANGDIVEYINNTWTLLNNFGLSVTSLIIDNTNNILYASTSNGNVWKHGGSIWSNLGIPDGSSVNTLALDDNNKLYAATSGDINQGMSGQVYSYTQGNVWTRIGNLTYTYNSTENFINVSGVQSIVIESNATIYAATNSFTGSAFANGGGIVYKKSDEAESWEISGSNSIDGTQVLTVAVDKNGTYYAGTDIGLYTYLNQSWSLLIPPLQNVSPYIASIAIDNNGNVYGVGESSQLIYKYNKQTESIIVLPPSPTPTNPFRIAIDNANNLYVANQGTVTTPCIFKYIPNVNADGGIYESLGANGPNDPSNIYGVNSIVINSNNDIFVAESTMVWKYPHDGNAWVSLLDSSYLTDGYCWVKALTLDKDNNLYAATGSDQTNINCGYVFKLANDTNSNSWELITNTMVNNGIPNITTDQNNNIYITSPVSISGSTATVFMYNNNESIFLPSYYGNYVQMYQYTVTVAGI